MTATRKLSERITPGPWRYVRTHRLSNDYWYVITDADGYGPIMEVGGKDRNGQVAEAKYLITDPETIEANAELIAMAPDLLRVCEAMAEALQELHDLMEEVRIGELQTGYVHESPAQAALAEWEKLAGETK